MGWGAGVPTYDSVLTNFIVGGTVLLMSSPLALEIIRRPDPAAAVLDSTRQRLLAHLVEPDSATGLARRLRLPRLGSVSHLEV